MRVALICGSQRQGSLNARLLGELAALIPAGTVGDRVAPGEILLPLYDHALEGDPRVVAHVQMLHARIASAQALIVASPEFNGLMTPFLKNLVDWVSRLPRIAPGTPDAFLDTPVLLASASPGWSGGALGLLSLRTLFGHVGAVTFGETVALPYADRAWGPDGAVNPMLRSGWAETVTRFCAYAGGRPRSLAA